VRNPELQQDWTPLGATRILSAEVALARVRMPLRFLLPLFIILLAGEKRVQNARHTMACSNQQRALPAGLNLDSTHDQIVRDRI